MGKLILFILERCPWLEVMIRCFLWKFPKIKEFIRDRHSNVGQGKQVESDPAIWERIKDKIRECNIKEGDILLVHSSMDNLTKRGVTSKEVIDFLLELVGQEGTLVFAAYPKCKNFKGNEEILYYDPRKTVSWTGMLPNVFCRYDDVVRTDFPYNSLAAKGKYAAAMMENNLLDDTSQAAHSAWQFCVDHYAKILYIGVSAALSCTMMNYPEDALGDEWYVKDWYGTQQYAIKCGNEIIYKTIRERYPDWYRFYAMFHSEYWMRNNGYLTKSEVEDIYIGFTEDMHGMADELLRLGREGKSVYRIPKKYYKSFV